MEFWKEATYIMCPGLKKYLVNWQIFLPSTFSWLHLVSADQTQVGKNYGLYAQWVEVSLLDIQDDLYRPSSLWLAELLLCLFFFFIFFMNLIHRPLDKPEKTFGSDQYWSFGVLFCFSVAEVAWTSHFLPLTFISFIRKIKSGIIGHG